MFSSFYGRFLTHDRVQGRVTSPEKKRGGGWTPCPSSETRTAPRFSAFPEWLTGLVNPHNAAGLVQCFGYRVNLARNPPPCCPPSYRHRTAIGPPYLGTYRRTDSVPTPKP